MKSSLFSTVPVYRLAKVTVQMSVLVAFMGQQLAFAAPTQSASSRVASTSAISSAISARLNKPQVLKPLVFAKTARQAVAVVQSSELRPVAAYFIKGGDAPELAAFKADLTTLAKANEMAGTADDISSYLAWWDKNQTLSLLQRNHMMSTSLQGFFFETFIKFKAEKLASDKSGGAFFEWLSHQVNNPVIMKVTSVGYGIVNSVFNFVSGIVVGALIAGPAAGMVGALLDPIVRPYREKFAVWGGKLLGKPGAFFYRVLFAPKKMSADDIAKMEKGVGEVRNSQAEVRRLINSMSQDMTPDDFTNNVKKLQDIWNETNRAWAMYTPAGFKDGRGLIVDAVMFRPFWFSMQTVDGVVGAETFRQGIEAMTDRIIVRTGAQPKAVDAAVDNLMKAVEGVEATPTDVNQPKLADHALKTARAELIAIGATDSQIDRIVTSRATELALARHAASALAANIIHDVQYEEFNRSLPDVAKPLQEALRSNYCLDFFHREFNVEVRRILNQIDFRVEAIDKTIKDPAARAALTEKSLKEAVTPKGAESAKPIVAAAKPKGRIVSFVRASVEPARARASRVLSRLNRISTNQVAVERVAVGEKGDSLAARARESVKVISRK